MSEFRSEPYRDIKNKLKTKHTNLAVIDCGETFVNFFFLLL